MLWAVLAVAAVAALVSLTLAKDPSPIFGVYREPGPRFWIKYAFIRAALWLRKVNDFFMRQRREAGKPRASLEDKERALPLSNHPLAFDAVFFIATNADGVYVLAGSERRKHNVSNGLCYVLMPGVGLLRSHKLPDTILFGTRDGEFGAEGLRIYPVKPHRSWKIEYNGSMHLNDDPTKGFKVTLDGEWISDCSVFNFDTDLHPHAIAKMISREPWSKQFFKSLQDVHQTHYEQMGYLRGTLQIGEDKHNLDLMSFRDHSYGVARDWTHMHRYAFFQFFLEDNTRAVVGVISHPANFSLMETGYVQHPDGAREPLEWCDLQLYQHGEMGAPPRDHAFSFKAGRTVYRVKVQVEDQGIHFVGWRWEARMVERLVRCEINGVPGRGVSEFHYRHREGRSAAAARSDPPWFAQVLEDTYRGLDEH